VGPPEQQPAPAEKGEEQQQAPAPPPPLAAAFLSAARLPAPLLLHYLLRSAGAGNGDPRLVPLAVSKEAVQAMGTGAEVSCWEDGGRWGVGGGGAVVVWVFYGGCIFFCVVSSVRHPTLFLGCVCVL
jgi:hypothetical protein